jgi:two-component system sensor kinase FixL
MTYLKKVGVAFLFSLAFIAVDQLSYIHPIGGLNITPWNPPAALEVMFLFLVGNGWMTWVYLTLGVSDTLVRDTQWMSPAVVLGNGVLVLCYSLIALSLRRIFVNRISIQNRQDVLMLGMVIVCGALLTAASYVGMQTWIGVLPEADAWGAAYRFFIGDLLGLVVLLPLFFVALDKRRRAQYRQMFRSAWFWILMAGLLLCLWLVFSFPTQDQMKYFFIFFFLLGLMAASYSLPGATLVAALIQLPLVFSATRAGVQPNDLIDMQVVMLSLSLTGLIIGAVVDERLRTEERLRDSLQLAAAGELAGSLAHELHQPMSALSAYSEAALMLTELQKHEMTDVRQAQLTTMLQKIVNEALRATDVVRGLRSYFISGASSLQKTSINALVEKCQERFVSRAAKEHVSLVTIYAETDHEVWVDSIQISTALGNLMKNAIDASKPGNQVVVQISLEEKHMLSIGVSDEGTHLDAESIEQIFRPFYSKKKDGLGLGLSLSKSLVENNGGTLRYLSMPRKCFQILLPLEDPVNE